MHYANQSCQSYRIRGTQEKLSSIYAFTLILIEHLCWNPKPRLRIAEQNIVQSGITLISK